MCFIFHKFSIYVHTYYIRLTTKLTKPIINLNSKGIFSSYKRTIPQKKIKKRKKTTQTATQEALSLFHLVKKKKTLLNTNFVQNTD